ncbi:MAG: TIGR01212 family radical SAM protein [Candidatus Omnitrophica bacterium]|nr:TIGR01212 family radical SAM protein [Candidatus Omnitrophota bacterium]
MKYYNDYGSYLKAKFGCKVYRIGLDAGFTCPTRDGTMGYGGCAFCNANGSRSSYTDPTQTIKEQLTTRIEYLKKAKGIKKFIAYFQAFTNTYAPIEKLKEIYDNVLPFKEIVGITIGTRPDTIDQEKLKLILSYKERYDLWIEYGLQSAHDATLEAINRCHRLDDFVKALCMTREHGIPVCAHVILGLPQETREEMIQTARTLSEFKVEGVKIHLLHILKGSRLESLYREGRVRILEQDEYVKLVCDFLENLPETTIIQRLTGEGKRSDHIAPLWALDKMGTIKKIEEEFSRRGSHQGSAISSSRSLFPRS